MEILHTPWRRSYVTTARAHRGCLFCELLARGSDAASAPDILECTPRACLMLNAFPYTPGHLMAIPYRHAPALAALEEGELAELLALAARAERLLRRAYGCRAVYTGANLGSSAGAGVPEHLHLHIVARPESPMWERCAGAAQAPETIAQSRARLEQAARELEDQESP